MSSRRYSLGTYHGFYERVGEAGDPCVYCGVLASTVDHVPPVSVYAAMPDQARVHFRPKIYPSCRECNETLGVTPVVTLTERRAYVKHRLSQKYRRLLNAPDWRAEEIEDLGPSLKDMLRYDHAMSDHVRQRVRVLREGGSRRGVFPGQSAGPASHAGPRSRETTP